MNPSFARRSAKVFIAQVKSSTPMPTNRSCHWRPCNMTDFGSLEAELWVPQRETGNRQVSCPSHHKRPAVEAGRGNVWNTFVGQNRSLTLRRGPVLLVQMSLHIAQSLRGISIFFFLDRLCVGRFFKLSFHSSYRVLQG